MNRKFGTFRIVGILRYSLFREGQVACADLSGKCYQLIARSAHAGIASRNLAGDLQSQAMEKAGAGSGRLGLCLHPVQSLASHLQCCFKPINPNRRPSAYAMGVSDWTLQERQVLNLGCGTSSLGLELARRAHADLVGFALRVCFCFVSITCLQGASLCGSRASRGECGFQSYCHRGLDAGKF